MITRGERSTETEGDIGEHEASLSGTLYWTLSLYVEPHAIAATLGRPEDGRIKPQIFRDAQIRHFPSFALRNAVDPLMNDIADRETLGEVQEYILAATDKTASSLEEANAIIRSYEELYFHLPSSTCWATEGICFNAHPAGLADRRLIRMRRFWLSHNNGALSYHMSFSHYYGSYIDGAGQLRSGYDPATYYFLSLLQKLAAPKEYTLSEEWLKRLQDKPETPITVFDQKLGIDPLDNIRISRPDGLTFWSFVREQFGKDAQALFPRLASALGVPEPKGIDYPARLLEYGSFIEIPGLKVPKSRFMFVLHDERFFNALMPQDRESQEHMPRKAMVQEACYAPYQARIDRLTRPIAGKSPTSVHLGAPVDGVKEGESCDDQYWEWVCDRDEYLQGLNVGAFVRLNPDWQEGEQNPHGAVDQWIPIAPNDLEGLAAAMQSGDCMQIKEFDGTNLERPLEHRIPAFAVRRSDCLDYLFLSGFNQNIIDFMNQDTSEILDSIDPIYPDSSEQSDERFFVRYANHRAMITYVPKSRSLEIGNDYIGTCPYAFLIHALALHNEFLARAHESKSMARIERIEWLIADNKPTLSTQAIEIEKTEPLDTNDSEYDKAEMAINQAKLAEFSQYERFRYNNPFRYDTERDVFRKLEELRGTSRKTEALALAISSLEDHAADLQRRRQYSLDRDSARRDARLNILLGGTGVFGAGQMIYWIGEKANDGRPVNFPFREGTEPTQFGDLILSYTEMAMWIALFIFLPLLIYIIVEMVVKWFRARRVARKERKEHTTWWRSAGDQS